VTLVNDEGAPTIADIRDAKELEMQSEAAAHPLVKAVFDSFPDAKIINIRTAAEISQEAAVEALQEVEDEWDPFEDD